MNNKNILSTNKQKKIRVDGTNELQNEKQHKCKPIETKVRYCNNQENWQAFILINTEKKKIQISKIWNKGEI